MILIARLLTASALALALPVLAQSGAKPAPKTKALSAQQAEGWRIAPLPAWTVTPPAAEPWTPPAGGKPRRDELVDLQIRLAGSATQHFMRLRSVALDASLLREVSEPQIVFNPAFQKVLIHHATVRRAGVTENRLPKARIEALRREQGLEQRMLDGQRTLLVVLPDVRVGDAVEIAYTVEGENPIFEGHFAGSFEVAGDAAADRVHLRFDAPAAQSLRFKGIGGATVEPTEQRVGERRVWSVLRQQVPATVDEVGTPPWVKVYPALHVSDWRDWAEVDAWAQRLFAAQPADAPLRAQAERIRALGLPPEGQVAEALRFVQDEVRYFSLSLGESSHRPKPAARTLAERLGDCKDKVLLLNSLLAELGVAAQPVLVSVRRNRGVANFLPGHDTFDHVVSRVRVGERDWLLDPTLANQGLTLAGRGFYDHGLGLVVGGSGGSLSAISPPADAVETLRWTQTWDLSRPGQRPSLTLTLQARGLVAEHMRATRAQAGSERWEDVMGGAYAKAFPGLTALAPAEVSDDRQRNELSARWRFEHPNPGRYERGGLQLDVPALELYDFLATPPEARRRHAFLNQMPRRVEHEVEVLGPRPLIQRNALVPVTLNAKAMSLQARPRIDGARAVLSTTLERRALEVLPGELDTHREQMQKMRQQLGGQVWLPLFDRTSLQREMEQADLRLRLLHREAGGDQLTDLLRELEFSRLYANQALSTLGGPQAPMAGEVLVAKALAANQLDAPGMGLASADAALALQAEHKGALEARGAALMALGRQAEALQVFERWAALDEGASAPLIWLAIAQWTQGQAAPAETQLRRALPALQGEGREFPLLWLALAAERQTAGRGAKVLAEFPPEGGDADAWPRPLRAYLSGTLSREALLQAASREPAARRLRLAEAHFFIGALLQARGAPPAEWRPAMQRVVDTQATPYREYLLARAALR